jgi:hypothetical protein
MTSFKKILRVLAFTVGWALLFLGFVQSAGTIAAWMKARVAVQGCTVCGFAAWTRGEMGPFTFWDGFWILLLPVLIGIYLRYFSVFRKDCPACSADAAKKDRHCGLADRSEARAAVQGRTDSGLGA